MASRLTSSHRPPTDHPVLRQQPSACPNYTACAQLPRAPLPPTATPRSPTRQHSSPTTNRSPPIVLRRFIVRSHGQGRGPRSSHDAGDAARAIQHHRWHQWPAGHAGECTNLITCPEEQHIKERALSVEQYRSNFHDTMRLSL